MQIHPYAVLGLVICAGALDGTFRGYHNLPTVFGEEVAVRSTRHSYDTELLQMSASQVETMLAQQPVGSPCHESWNCEPGLVCASNTCSSCQTDEECIERNTKNQCQNNTHGVPKCSHKPLWHPFDSSDMWITIITFFTITLAAPAGVGGGGILVPMYLAIGHFSPHYGIPLSKATIFGGAVTNNLINLPKRHPAANRPLIDYTTCMLLEPVLLLGTVLGVFFNAVAPGWLISILLVLTLILTTYRTGIKAYETYIKEEANQAQAETQRLLPAGNKGSSGKAIPFDEEHDAPPALREILKSESEHNFFSIGVLAISWIIIGVFSLLKGGEGGVGMFPCGSFGYWILVLAPLPLITAIVWYVGNLASARYEEKVDLGFEFADGDLRWTRSNVRVYPLYCISAGFAAGALGIAAGTILGPVLLELGLLPIVATTSSGFMVIFTSSSTTFQFLVMGQLQMDYAIFFCGIGLLGGAIGNTVVGYIVKKYKKTWFIVAILTFVLFMSCFLMGYAGYIRFRVAETHGKNMGIRNLCPMELNPNLLHSAQVGNTPLIK